MGPRQRRVVQALLYEVGAVLFVGPALAWVFSAPVSSSLGLAMVLSGVALAWNYLFNALFEHWESRQVSRQRTWMRRLLH